MRISTLLAVATGVCVMAVSVSAQMKVGYINSDVILVKYEGAKEAADKLNKEVAKWEQEASKRQNDLKALKDKIDKQSLILSAERRKELEDSLQQKYAQYQQFLQEKFGQKGEAYNKNEELSKPIVEKVNKIIAKIAKEEGYDFIFDARAGGLVYANAEKYDLTDRVLMLLNKEK
jgi:outer membrane protein